MTLQEAITDYEQAANVKLAFQSNELINEAVGNSRFVIAAHYGKVGSNYKVTFVYDVIGNSWTLGAD